MGRKKLKDRPTTTARTQRDRKRGRTRIPGRARRTNAPTAAAGRTDIRWLVDPSAMRYTAPTSSRWPFGRVEPEVVPAKDQPADRGQDQQRHRVDLLVGGALAPHGERRSPDQHRDPRADQRLPPDAPELGKGAVCDQMEKEERTCRGRGGQQVHPDGGRQTQRCEQQRPGTGQGHEKGVPRRMRDPQGVACGNIFAGVPPGCRGREGEDIEQEDACASARGGLVGRTAPLIGHPSIFPPLMTH